MLAILPAVLLHNRNEPKNKKADMALRLTAKDITIKKATRENKGMTQSERLWLLNLMLKTNSLQRDQGIHFLDVNKELT